MKYGGGLQGAPVVTSVLGFIFLRFVWKCMGLGSAVSMVFGVRWFHYCAIRPLIQNNPIQVNRILLSSLLSGRMSEKKFCKGDDRPNTGLKYTVALRKMFPVPLHPYGDSKEALK